MTESTQDQRGFSKMRDRPDAEYEWFPGVTANVELRDKVCVVTGVTGFIGLNVMRGLLMRGAKVVMIGRNAEKIALYQQQNDERFPGRSAHFVANLESEEELRLAAKQALGVFGPIDILVNSAGLMLESPWETASVTEHLENSFRVNVVAPFILCQEFLESLIGQKGQVVFVNSSSVQSIGYQKTPYTATKFAMKGLADSFREEFNRHGVRTLSVYPGRTATDMQRRLHAGRGEAFHPERLSQPEDVAGVILHLLQMPMTSEVTELFLRPMQNWAKK
jgi:NAD(P)-dependent dehydrogenase (short-subunit alcohol dehydrogenase family)